jgi:hypothetical protein
MYAGAPTLEQFAFFPESFYLNTTTKFLLFVLMMQCYWWTAA